MKVTVFGATGRTGRLVVSELLARGHSVIAAVRTPDRLGALRERVDVRVCDLAAPNVSDAVTGAVNDADAVISCAGHDGSTPPHMMALLADALVAAAPTAPRLTRIVALAGGAALLAGETPHGAQRALRLIMGVVAGKMLRDTEVFTRTLAGSALDVVIARPPRLIDGPRTGRVRAGSDLRLGFGDALVRDDLAAFLVDQLATPGPVDRAPYVATAKTAA